MFAQTPPLPRRVIRILDTQRRKPARPAGAPCLVERSQFPVDHLQRPAVAERVMQSDQQDMFVILDLQQARPQDGSMGQIKGTPCLSVNQLPSDFLTSTVFELAQIDERQLKRGATRNDRVRSSTDS
nr:hypothetical protein [uncultured bacterium]